MDTMMNKTERAIVNWYRGLFQPPPGTHGGLGATKQAAAAFLYLAENYQHQDYRYKDLRQVQVNQ